MSGSKLDEDFTATMLGQIYVEIERMYGKFSKHEKIRIDQWSRKLCQVTTNAMWKKNRNNYADLLLEMCYSEHLEPPFSKVPPDGPLPQLNRSVVGNMQVGGVHRKGRPSWNQQNTAPRPHSAQGRPLHNTSITQSAPLISKLQTPQQRPPKPQVQFENPSPKVTIKKEYPHRSDEEARLRAQLEIAQSNEKYLRDELYNKSRIINEQNKLIEELRAELYDLKQIAPKRPPIEAMPLRQETSGENFFKYLETFQHEANKLTQETQHLLNKYSKDRKSNDLGISPVKPYMESPQQETLEQAPYSDILGIEEINQNMRRLDMVQRDINRLKFTSPKILSSGEQSLTYSGQSIDDF